MSKEQRYERILRFLAKENIPEGFGNVDLDIHEYAYKCALKRCGRDEDIDDYNEDDYFEALLLLIEKAIENENQ